MHFLMQVSPPFKVGQQTGSAAKKYSILRTRLHTIVAENQTNLYLQEGK